MKKKMFIALGLTVLATPAFVKNIIVIDDERQPGPFTLPEAPKPIQIPESNDFINEKMKRLRRRK